MEELLHNAIGLAGLLIIPIGIVVQLIKQTTIDNRWMPHVSIILGIVVGVIFGYALGQDMFLYGFAGFLSGAGASGVYDFGKNTIRKIKEG